MAVSCHHWSSRSESPARIKVATELPNHAYLAPLADAPRRAHLLAVTLSPVRLTPARCVLCLPIPRSTNTLSAWLCKYTSVARSKHKHGPAVPAPCASFPVCFRDSPKVILIRSSCRQHRRCVHAGSCVPRQAKQLWIVPSPRTRRQLLVLLVSSAPTCTAPPQGPCRAA
jgi:hypothetical protein